MSLTVYNTLTSKHEPFVPIDKNQVRMYVCGITPYDVCHVGHARCYVVFDLIRRVLKENGFKVRYIQNFTDVDDKIIARSQERGISVQELVQANVDDYFNKMDALGIERADVYPRVTDHMPDIIALIRTLVDKKAAYPMNGDVYFSVRKDENYGKLSKRPLEELILGARVEVNQDKKDPLDFALWKAAKPGEPAEVTWESPWGPGRPGWHIECSVMSMKYLGQTFDIHGGGLDLIFPHHENEIAQSESATGVPFSRVWLHNGFVTVNKEKMSKSLGNFFSLSEIFAKYHPAVVRYMLLSVHYRSPLDFSSDLLDQSRRSLAGLKDAIARATFIMRRQSDSMDSSSVPAPALIADIEALIQEFHSALANDFNAPEALGLLHRTTGLLEKQFAGNAPNLSGVRLILEQLRIMADVLGLDLFSFLQDVLVPSDVTAMALERENARKTNQWAKADDLRKNILERGFVVEDTAQGPRLLPKAH